MNEDVKRILENNMWDLATCLNGKPNVVPVAFKCVNEQGQLLVGDVFLETTLKNIVENEGQIAISAFDANHLEGYQIKGKAKYVTSGNVVEMFKKQVEDMFQNQATAKGALIITPEQIIVTTPGKDNKKIIHS